MMAAGGSLPGISAITELYDGTAWSETADLTTPRRNAGGCSTVNTAVVIAGGQVPAVTNICELWNTYFGLLKKTLNVSSKFNCY